MVSVGAHSFSVMFFRVCVDCSVLYKLTLAGLARMDTVSTLIPSQTCSICLEDKPGLELSACGAVGRTRSHTRALDHSVCASCLETLIQRGDGRCPACRDPLNYDASMLPDFWRGRLEDEQRRRQAARPRAPADPRAVGLDDQPWMTTDLVYENYHFPLYDPGNSFWLRGQGVEFWDTRGPMFRKGPMHDEYCNRDTDEIQQKLYAFLNMYMLAVYGECDALNLLFETYFNENICGDRVHGAGRRFISATYISPFKKYLLQDLCVRIPTLGRRKIFKELLQGGTPFHAPIQYPVVETDMHQKSTLEMAIKSYPFWMRSIADYCEEHSDLLGSYDHQKHWIDFRSARGDTILHLAAEFGKIAHPERTRLLETDEMYKKKYSFLYRILADEKVDGAFVSMENHDGKTALQSQLEFDVEAACRSIKSSYNFRIDTREMRRKIDRIEILCSSEKTDDAMFTRAVNVVMDLCESLLSTERSERVPINTRRENQVQMAKYICAPLNTLRNQILKRAAHGFKLATHPTDRLFLLFVKMNDAAAVKLILENIHDSASAGIIDEDYMPRLAVADREARIREQFFQLDYTDVHALLQDCT